MKRILVVLLSFYLAFAPVLANAASLGGWSIGGSVVNGASVILSGSKELILNGASKIANGTAKITPTAAQVSKALAGGAAAVALDLAIKELLGAVDYVLDPANNSITYSQGSKYIYQTRALGAYYKNIADAANATCTEKGWGTATSYSKFATQSSSPYESWTANCSNGYTYQFYLVDNPSSTGNSEPKSLPLSTVSNEIISMAEGGNATAQQAIKAAADTIVAEAETDSTKARPIVSQFEQTSTIETSETATSTSETTTTADPAETATTDTTTTFPVFCSWAPTICQAANVVIQKPSEWAESIQSAYDDAVEYFKSETDVPAKSTDDIYLPDTPIVPVTANVSWGEQCPEPTTTTITFAGQTKDIQIIRYDFICEWAWVVKASVIALASIGAVFIIAGRKS